MMNVYLVRWLFSVLILFNDALRCLLSVAKASVSSERALSPNIQEESYHHRHTSFRSKSFSFVTLTMAAGNIYGVLLSDLVTARETQT